MKENLSKLEALLSRFYSELLERCYAKSTYYAYRSAGARLVKWCDKNSILEYDEDVGKRFCEYIDDFYKGRRSHKWDNISARFVRLLNSLQKGDDFEYRKPNPPHPFRVESISIVNNFLDYCGSSMQSSKASINDKRLLLSRLDSFMEKNGNLSIISIDTELVEKFVTAYATQLSRRKYKGVLKQFYHYLFESKVTDQDLSLIILNEPSVPRENKLPTTYSEDEIRRIIDSSVLGHKCIESTKVYVGVDIEMLRKCSLDIPELQSPHYYYTKKRTL